MHLFIVGTGYVGLVTGCCFAEMGHHVTCLDVDREKIKRLSKGEVPFYEPGVEEKLQRNLRAGRLCFTCDYDLKGIDILFIAVPTPHGDLSFVENASREIGRHLDGPLIVATKSTVPVGTTLRVKEWIGDVAIASNPEFLKEGDAVRDCMKPSRIIVGVEEPEVAEKFRELYAPFNLSSDRLLVMDIASAELAKYAANAMLATRISFMNELSQLCEAMGADIGAIRQSMGMDPRIGKEYLYAGLGFGGSCLPKDLQTLQASARDAGCKATLLAAVEEVNERQREHFLNRILEYFGDLTGVTLALWGLSFKPDTDDLRDAPSLFLARELRARGAELRLYDPVARPQNLGTFCPSAESAAVGASGILLATEWKEFRALNFPTILGSMKGRAFFDGRNQYSPEAMAALGFDYMSIGRGAQLPALV